MGRKERRTFQPSFIREWRKFRRLSLARLVNLLEDDPKTGRPFITPTSLSRIERGLQPYSQPLLEALAVALECEPGDLISRNPMDSEGLWSVWRQLSSDQRKQAVELLKVLTRAA